jgi:putative ABC transport system ATP-binding protein
LALAAGRGGWLSHVKKEDKAQFRDRLALLNMGLEDRMKQPVGLLSGGQRQALTLLMATMEPPKLLLLDEHTAALDPKTAAKVLETTEKIVQQNHLTTLMITHNMKDAIAHGNRLIMMMDGRIIFDIRGEEKQRLTVEELLHKFEVVSGQEFASDKALLS